MVQIRQAMARLRLFLAEIESRERDLNNMIRQFRTQRDRLPKQAIYGISTLDLALSAMAEIEDRLNHATGVKQHLMAFKQRALDELSALVLTQQVEEAKDTLRELRELVQSGQGDESTGDEIRRLDEFITENSKKAERAITASFQESP